MGDTWIVDITHYEDILDPTLDIPESARRLGMFFGTIVQAATAWPFPDIPTQSVLRCRRRPGRKPCPGFLRVLLLEDKNEIAWGCSSCDDEGWISNWRGSHWDLSFDAEDPRDYDETLDVRLTAEEAAALVRMPWYDDGVRRTIMAAHSHGNDINLWGTEEELDDLLDAVAGEANHELNRTWRKRLDSAFDKIEAELESGR